MNFVTIFTRLVVVLACWSSFIQAFAYPTLARHGYTTCTTCHYNPSGGGMLTSYGKYIAGELFGALNDSSTALPYLKTPAEEPVFDAMLMTRVAQTYFDTPQVLRADFRKMQFDLEAGFVRSGYQAIAAVGPKLDAAIEGKEVPSTLTARRYWIGKVTLEYALRAGKFFPEYGIYYYNHNIPTRKGLYFNHNEEPFNIQFSKFTETFDFTIAAIKGAPDSKLADMNGGVTTVSYKTGTKRFGISALRASSDEQRRTLSYGPFAQVGFWERGYLLAELDAKQSVNAKGNQTNERLGFAEVGWEVAKAVNPYTSADYYHNQTLATTVTTPKIGLQVHPITHLEIIAEVGSNFIKTKETSSMARQAVFMVNSYF